METVASMKIQPMTEKSEEAAATGQPSDQTPVSLESARFPSDPKVGEVEEVEEDTNYLQGWPLHVVTLASVSTVMLAYQLLINVLVRLCLAIFLVSLEVSIVSTSLVSITNSLQGFSQGTWIVTAYLLTYTGFLIIAAKLSDIYGRKFFLIASLLLFVLFSGACGAAQTTTQLIIFRALQGLGGSGTYALVLVIFFELIPPEKFATYTSAVSGVLALALLLGPLLGGLINNYTTWRWIFLLNVPAGVVAMVVLMITIPTNFPYHGRPGSGDAPKKIWEAFSKKSLKRVDFLGATLLLAASLLFVTPLEEAGLHYGWGSAFVITLLVLSGFLWVAFLAWERKVTSASSVREPVFPWRFMQSRVRMGLILSMFLTGAPFTVAVIQIPLRFQTLYNISALGAGIRLLPFAVSTPIGTGVCAAIAGRAKIPPIYLIPLGAMIQILGFALLSTAPTGTSPSNAQYGYQVIAGFGVGMNLSCLVVMTPFSVEKRDKSVAMSAMIQFRTMGGVIGLAIVTSVLNNYIRSHLAQVLSADQINVLLRTTDAFAALPPEVKESVRIIFARGYDLQLQVMIGFSAAQLPASLLMWKKKQIVV